MTAPAAMQDDGFFLEARAPRDGRLLGRIPMTPVAELAGLVAEAREAGRAWATLAMKERVRRLRNIRDRWLERGPELARILMDEGGKSEAEALTSEVVPSVDLLDYWLKAAPEFLAREPVALNPLNFPGKRGYIDYEPRGVVALITPWNYPSSIPLRAIVPALLAGNAIVWKPSEFSALSGRLVHEIFAPDLPPGLLQLVQGDGRVGEALVAEYRVRWLLREPDLAAGILGRLTARGHLDRGAMRTFLAVFHDRPADDARAALQALAKEQPPSALGQFAEELHAWHRDDLAWTLVEAAPGNDPLSWTLRHRTVGWLKGAQAASEWASAHPIDPSLSLELQERAFVEGNRDLLFDLPVPADPTRAAELWWWRASALAMARENAGSRFEQVRAALAGPPTEDLGTLAARALVGLVEVRDLAEKPVPGAKLPLVAFTLGNLAERAGRMSEAIEWYLDAIEFPDERRGASRFAWERLRAIQRSGKSLARLATEGVE